MIPHAGTATLRLAADRTGLTRALSQALRRPDNVQMRQVRKVQGNHAAGQLSGERTARADRFLGQTLPLTLRG